jgi:DNA processing protein
MKVKKLKLNSGDLPEVISNIPSRPENLFIMSQNMDEILSRPAIAVVGSRRITAYGKVITTQLVTELARAGVAIVSGLALGVDAVAHRATLDAGGITIAVLPCGLDTIYPASHRGLAEQILAQGGALLTEYPEGDRIYPSNFIARNRIVSGISRAVLITEAAEKSGTLHTARFALEQGKDVLAVPGNITSPTSAGTNNLIKTGATPVTNAADIFHTLGIKPPSDKPKPRGSTPQEQAILDLIYKGTSNGEDLLQQSDMDITSFSQTLTMLEITGKIRSLGANHWTT